MTCARCPATDARHMGFGSGLYLCAACIATLAEIHKVAAKPTSDGSADRHAICAAADEIVEAAPALLATVEAQAARIAELEQAMPVFQCGDCGGYVVSRDLAAPCPHCRAKELEAGLRDAVELLRNLANVALPSGGQHADADYARAEATRLRALLAPKEG